MTFDVHGRPCPRCLGHGRVTVVSVRDPVRGLWDQHREVRDPGGCPLEGEARFGFLPCWMCKGSGTAP